MNELRNEWMHESINKNILFKALQMTAELP